MPKIDDSIRKALAEAAEYYGSILAIAQKAGVSHSTLSKYQSGQIKTINQTTWNALEPHLRPFLPADSKNIGIKTGNHSPAYGNTIIQGSNGVNTVPASDLIEQFRRAALDGIIDLDIDPVAQAAVLKFLKNLNLKK